MQLKGFPTQKQHPRESVSQFRHKGHKGYDSFRDPSFILSPCGDGFTVKQNSRVRGSQGLALRVRLLLALASLSLLPKWTQWDQQPHTSTIAARVTLAAMSSQPYTTASTWELKRTIPSFFSCYLSNIRSQQRFLFLDHGHSYLALISFEVRDVF